MILDPIDRMPFHSAHSLAEAVAVLPLMIICPRDDSRSMKNLYLYWTEDRLIVDLRQNRISVSSEMVLMMEAQGRTIFIN
jgi:hypothetical protein